VKPFRASRQEPLEAEFRYRPVAEQREIDLLELEYISEVQIQIDPPEMPFGPISQNPTTFAGLILDRLGLGETDRETQAVHFFVRVHRRFRGLQFCGEQDRQSTSQETRAPQTQIFDGRRLKTPERSQIGHDLNQSEEPD
jgi:hypothetical protein